MKRLFIQSMLLPVLLAISACGSSKLSDEEKRAKEWQIARQVESKNYTIEVSQANPMRGRFINLSYGYDLKISNDSVYAHLPYFGVARTAPLGNGAIQFAAPMTLYTISPTKDGWSVRFRIEAREQKHDFTLDIFKNGKTSVTVSPLQRDPISFWGEIKM